MIKSLEITNFTLIEHSNIEFREGFSVITGQTGAGKSIILGALGMLMGGKVDTKYFKDATNKCVIEAIFDVSGYGLKPYFDEQGLDYDDECVIRKEISPNGKARQFVNDTPVSLSDLKFLGEHLIDIHSQHKNLLIKDSEFQLSVLDSVSDSKDKIEVYRNAYNEWKNANSQLKSLIEESEQDSADREYELAVYEKLKNAELVEGEQEELEKEINILENAERILDSLNTSIGIIDESESSILASLATVSRCLTKAGEYVPELISETERLQSVQEELKDVLSVLTQYREKSDVNPTRISTIQERLDTIYTLERRHKTQSLSELIEIRDKMAAKLDRTSSYEDEIAELKIKVDKLYQNMVSVSNVLTKHRSDGVPVVENTVKDMLKRMGMTAAEFKVEMSLSDSFGQNGRDIVSFLFSANKGKTPMPISEIASGGEISRVMLSLKALLSKVTAMPTLVLDEIDTGISGEVANLMGEVMKSMSDKIQVIAITHLPQVAAKGQWHYRVYKQDEDDKTVSHIVMLNEDERVYELAEMLSGSNPTESAIANAKDLMVMSMS